MLQQAAGPSRGQGRLRGRQPHTALLLESSSLRPADSITSRRARLCIALCLGGTVAQNNGVQGTTEDCNNHMLCPANAKCVNNTHCTCLDGYWPRENHPILFTDTTEICDDINKCQGPSPPDCGRNTNCINMVRSYYCTCIDGYEPSSGKANFMNRHPISELPATRSEFGSRGTPEGGESSGRTTKNLAHGAPSPADRASELGKALWSSGCAVAGCVYSAWHHGAPAAALPPINIPMEPGRDG